MAPWTIYQEHLRGLDQGLPLWDPSPKNALEIIEGSVIYPGVSGTFSVLFNARKSADDARWQPHGVPRGFRTLDDEFGPLVVDGPRELIGLRGWNCRSVECTRNVSGDLDVGIPATGAGLSVTAGGGFKLTCRKKSGALLALAHDPTMTYIESSAHITSYMIRHHADWLDMANSQSASGLGLGLKLEDLYFVSGTTKVPQWFIGVFDGGEESEGGGRLECTVTDVFNLNVGFSDIHLVHRSPVLKKGPRSADTGAELLWNQCAFIHYFKMKQRRLRLPKIIKAAAGPHQLPGSESEGDSLALLASDGNDNLEVEVEEVCGRSKVLDPVDALLDYILESSNADLAIASDKDVSALVQRVTGDLRASLCELKPLISIDEHGAGTIKVCPAVAGCRELIDTSIGIRPNATRFDSDPLTDVSSDRRNTSDRPLSITPLLSHSRISLLSEPNGPMTTRPTATAPLTSVPAEIRPLSSIEGSSTEMSVVSGHASSSEHDAVLRSIVSRAYENWKIADSAAQRLLADLRAVEECEMQLGLARKRRREEQKSARSANPDDLTSHARPRVKWKFVKSFKSSGASVSPQHQADTPTDSRSGMEPTVLEAQLENLKHRIIATRPAADRLDGHFKELKVFFTDERRNPTCRGSGSLTSIQDTRARAAVEDLEQVCRNREATTKALRSACRAVYSSYNFYSNAIGLVDQAQARCLEQSPREALFEDKRTRQEAYHEAVEWAKRAQLCFNECVNALQLYPDLLEGKELQDFKDLQAINLSVAAVTQEANNIAAKHDRVFDCLREFALCIGNRFMLCEKEALDERESLDAARRHLVALWVKSYKGLAHSQQDQNIFTATVV